MLQFILNNFIIYIMSPSLQWAAVVFAYSAPVVTVDETQVAVQDGGSYWFQLSMNYDVSLDTFCGIVVSALYIILHL